MSKIIKLTTLFLFFISTLSGQSDAAVPTVDKVVFTNSREQQQPETRQVRIGFSRIVNTAPWRRKETTTGIAGDISARFSNRWWMSFSFQFNKKIKGLDIPFPNRIYPFPLIFGPPSIGSRFYFGPSYFFRPEKKWQFYLMGGPAMFKSEKTGNQDFGTIWGTGMRFLGLRTGLLYYLPFQSRTPSLEWNLGIDFTL